MSPSPPTKLAPLTCEGCGAAVSLPESDEASCASCGATVRVPGAYRELRAEVEAVRRARREAEARWC